MEDYNQIIESLSIRYIKAQNIDILRPISIENNYEVENTLMIINNGQLKYGKQKEDAGVGDILFVPGGKMVSMTYGQNEPELISKEDFLGNKESYFLSTESIDDSSVQDSFSYVSFEAKAFDSVNFFGSLDIPAFKIRRHEEIKQVIHDINIESSKTLPGKDRMVKILTERLVVELIRHILKQGLFVEQLATNSTYFRDPRLIDLFGFIKENLSDDLSNKVLANVANVSEDYVGQYFKMLTGINPQDYIEYQRMEMAVNLLRTSKRSIHEIGKDVGYKDTAYFCRRFKMMFGIPAGKMRRRESLSA
ncbi:MAG: helix-turn-helix transcriptional regulator [Cytophagales bacterium]|nr:helix-turn-helix transcriptional regulator [Cytophagales bacterium]